ncbi:MAG: sigma 54-interacting transcriptional regulator [Deltaproteobacteria bacterium]|nr:sigma 54-interacting transcriptional regulator [Deltaproteobacteria bacterium]
MPQKLNYEKQRGKELEMETVERTWAEEPFHQTERPFRILTEQVDQGVTLVQDGKFVLVNGVFASMLGYTDSKQLIGKRPAELISTDFDQGIKEMYGSVESGIPREKTFRMPCLTQEGRKSCVEGHHNIIKWNNRPAILTTFRDIGQGRLGEIPIREETGHLQRENNKTIPDISNHNRFGNIIGKSQAMQEVYDLISKTAASDSNVLIYGESGTGKELVARAIHDTSKRRDRAFVPVNCGAIPETLLESEFFGHTKGAFTGAYIDKHGYLDLAHGGTLFLDEVAELVPGMQVKLLRAIDLREYTPVGSSKPKTSGFRVIAATNRNLMDQVNRGLMREDFFYRIHIIPITLPSLRDRKEDMPLLIDHFLHLYADGKKPTTIPEKILDAMYNYHWPGNIRELQNVLHRYLTVKRLDFLNFGSPNQPVRADGVSVKKLTQQNNNLCVAIENVEKALISKALDQTHWNRTKAALLLGISRRALFRKIKNLGII